MLCLTNTVKIEGNDTDVEGKPSVYETLSAPNPFEISPFYLNFLIGLTPLNILLTIFRLIFLHLDCV